MTSSVAPPRSAAPGPTASNLTLLDECFRVAGRTTWYQSVDEIQTTDLDLDRYLAKYNLQRSHQGYRLKGWTPAQALCEGLGRDELPPLTYRTDSEEETIVQTEAAIEPARSSRNLFARMGNDLLIPSGISSSTQQHLFDKHYPLGTC